MPRFASALGAWQKRHGRRGLPWQGTRDPYRIWLSEVMLQQTQVAAVIPYYERFVARFPDVASLASASEDEVLKLWSGLGYYARGRNLLRAARQIGRQGGFPATAAAIAELPGVGRSTAAAIAAFAFGERAAILDGNVKRVLARCFAVETPRDLWPLAERLLPQRGIEAYTQGLMDLGATICVARIPRCGACPLADQCPSRGRRYEPLRKQSRFEGSFRQRRARTLTLVAERPRRRSMLDREATESLATDGLVQVRRGLVSLPDGL